MSIHLLYWYTHYALRITLPIYTSKRTPCASGSVSP